MFFLAVGIACNIILLVVLKSFQKFSVAAFPAIVVNYFVAGSFSLLFTSPKSIYLQSTHLWWPAATLGILLVSVFYMISLTTQKMGVSVATVANKMSVVIPVILAFIIYGDSVTVLKISGIVLALLSVIFVSSNDKGEKSTDNKSFLLPLGVFIGSGLIDSLVNYGQKKIVHSEIETACLSGLLFFAAGTFGLLAFIFFYPVKKDITLKKTLLAGVILGIPNYFSLYFIMKAISANIMQSSVLYPIINVCVVLGSSLSAFLFFSEKISAKNWFGIALSVLAIILIAYSSYS